jgi:hypothetical protein
MPTLIAINNSLRSGDDIRNRVEAVVWQQAVAIISEAANTPNHVNRLVWAKATLASMDALKAATEKAWLGIGGNTTVVNQGSAINDIALTAQVVAIIDTLLATG